MREGTGFLHNITNNLQDDLTTRSHCLVVEKIVQWTKFHVLHNYDGQNED